MEKKFHSSKSIAKESILNKREKTLNLDEYGQLLNGREKCNHFEEKPVKAQNGTETLSTTPECSMNTEIDENATEIQEGSMISNYDKWQKVLPRSRKNRRQATVNNGNYIKVNGSREMSSSQNHKHSRSIEHRTDKNYQQQRNLNASFRKAESLSQSMDGYSNRVKNTRTIYKHSNNFRNIRENGHLALNKQCVKNSEVKTCEKVKASTKLTAGTMKETKLEKESEVLNSSSKASLKRLPVETSSHLKNKTLHSKDTMPTQKCWKNTTLGPLAENSTLDTVRYGKEHNFYDQHQGHELKNQHAKIYKSEASVLKDAMVSISSSSSSEELRDATINQTKLSECVESSVQTNREKGRKPGKDAINLKKQKVKNSTNVENPNIAGDEDQHNDNAHLTEKEENIERNEHMTYCILHDGYYLPFWSVDLLQLPEFQPQINGYPTAETPDQHFDNSVSHVNYQNGFLRMNHDHNLYSLESIPCTNSEIITNGTSYNTELIHVPDDRVIQPWHHKGMVYYFKYADLNQRNYQCHMISKQQGSFRQHNQFTFDNRNSSYVNSPEIQQYEVHGTHYFVYH